MTTSVWLTTDLKSTVFDSAPDHLFLALTEKLTTESIDFGLFFSDQLDSWVRLVDFEFECDEILEKFDEIAISLDKALSFADLAHWVHVELMLALEGIWLVYYP